MDNVTLWVETLCTLWGHLKVKVSEGQGHLWIPKVPELQ
jgi:hypothetical protein